MYLQQKRPQLAVAPLIGNGVNDCPLLPLLPCCIRPAAASRSCASRIAAAVVIEGKSTPSICVLTAEFYFPNVLPNPHGLVADNTAPSFFPVGVNRAGTFRAPGATCHQRRLQNWGCRHHHAGAAMPMHGGTDA